MEPTLDWKIKLAVNGFIIQSQFRPDKHQTFVAESPRDVSRILEKLHAEAYPPAEDESSSAQLNLPIGD